MSTKRIKISFETVNNGKYTIIEAADMSVTSTRIKSEMKEVVREHEKKQALSQKQASQLVFSL